MPEIQEYLLENNNLKIRLLNYGLIFKSIKKLNAKNEWKELILGYPENDQYLTDSYFLGATIGRIAGRIGNSKFQFQDQEILLSPNENKNFLHGGVHGINKHFFKMVDRNSFSLTFQTTILQKDDGIPGDIFLEVKVSLEDDKIVIEYQAHSNQTTIINLTNHTYWNLNQQKSAVISNHFLDLSEAKYLELNQQLIPTGEVIDFDFTGKINSAFAFLNHQFQKGIDHFFIKKNQMIVLANDEFVVEFKTTEPGFVIYTGNFIQNLLLGNEILNKHTAICVEDQNYQDSVNNHLANWVLKKDEIYQKTTIWKIKANN